MSDPSFRFDAITEKYAARELRQLRQFAQSHVLPPDLAVEVGANRCRFLAALARRWPDRFCLGLEWRFKYAELGRSHLKAEGVENAAVLCADVHHALPLLVDDGQIADIFVLFPDPWWKLRHRKRRVIRPEFLDMLAPKMKPGGGLWVRTDVGPLADDMYEVLAAHPAFEALDVADYPVTPFPQTTRERHIIEQGLPIHALYYRRIA